MPRGLPVGTRAVAGSAHRAQRQRREVRVTSKMIAVRKVEEANLAWALIELAKQHLNTLDRNYAFAALGAGDTFEATHHIIKAVVAKRIPVRPEIAQQCLTWLDAYALHEQEHELHHLIESFLLPESIRGLALHASSHGRRHGTPFVSTRLTVSSRS